MEDARFRLTQMCRDCVDLSEVKIYVRVAVCRPTGKFMPGMFSHTHLLAAICAAVALRGPPICDPSEKPSPSDNAPSFVSCVSATRFAMSTSAGSRDDVRILCDLCSNVEFRV